jgi:ABC-type transport system involved in multi-copper enzyme maturation permease subunit
MFNKHQHNPMRTVWHSLLWKEWHEHKWKLAMLLLPVLAAAFAFWPSTPAMLPVFVVTALFCYSIVGLFIGMHTAAGENSRGTMFFLRTLPITMRKAAAIKLLMSWVTLVVPIVILISIAAAYLRWHAIDAVTLAEMGNAPGQPRLLSSWGFQNWLLGVGMSGVVCVTSLLLWMAAAGVNRADEVRAGAIGFLTMVGVWLCLGMLLYRAETLRSMDLAYSIRVMMSAAPGGPAMAGDQRGYWESYLPFITAAVLGHGLVIAWYLRRFGSPTMHSARTLDRQLSATKAGRLASPRKSQLTAIIWKQIHETGPLALIAAAAVVGMAGLVLWLNRAEPMRKSPGEVLAAITLSVGFLVTVVAGMGVFLEDVKPKVGIFWRSRPVNTTAWFFVKFSTGLVVLVVTFGALIALAFALEASGQLLDPDHAGLQVAFTALVFALIYTVSMACYCLGRHPIVAVVGALAILMSGGAIFGEFFDRSVPHWSVPLAVLLLAQVAATAIAWLAVRNNWGWTR